MAPVDAAGVQRDRVGQETGRFDDVVAEHDYLGAVVSLPPKRAVRGSVERFDLQQVFARLLGERAPRAHPGVRHGVRAEVDEEGKRVEEGERFLEHAGRAQLLDRREDGRRGVARVAGEHGSQLGFVVPQHGYGVADHPPGDETNDARVVGTAHHQVADEDDPILRPRPEALEQLAELAVATVHVADDMRGHESYDSSGRRQVRVDLAPRARRSPRGAPGDGAHRAGNRLAATTGGTNERTTF